MSWHNEWVYRELLLEMLCWSIIILEMKERNRKSEKDNEQKRNNLKIIVFLCDLRITNSLILPTSNKLHIKRSHMKENRKCNANVCIIRWKERSTKKKILKTG